MLRNMLNNSILLKLEASLIWAGRESRNESAEMTSYHNAEVLGGVLCAWVSVRGGGEEWVVHWGVQNPLSIGKIPDQEGVS